MRPPRTRRPHKNSMRSRRDQRTQLLRLADTWPCRTRRTTTNPRTHPPRSHRPPRRSRRDIPSTGHQDRTTAGWRAWSGFFGTVATSGASHPPITLLALSSVKCGNCQELHDTPDDVYNCYFGRSRSKPPAKGPKPATKISTSKSARKRGTYRGDHRLESRSTPQRCASRENDPPPDRLIRY